MGPAAASFPSKRRRDLGMGSGKGGIPAVRMKLESMNESEEPESTRVGAATDEIEGKDSGTMSW